MGVPFMQIADEAHGLAPDPMLRLQKEQQFQQWYRDIAKKLGINQDPDAKGHFYDYRAFYRDMQAGKPDVISPDKPGGHFPSTYKTPGHPRMYLNDGAGRIFDTQSGTYLTGEPVPQEGLTRSERQPDMPGFDPRVLMNAVSAWRGGR